MTEGCPPCRNSARAGDEGEFVCRSRPRGEADARACVACTATRVEVDVTLEAGAASFPAATPDANETW